MCDAYNNYYNIIAYTFAMYAAMGRIPFDQNFQKFRFKIKWNRKFPRFENFGSPLELSFFLEIWKFQKIPVPFGISTQNESVRGSFIREKLQDGGEAFKSTLHWLQNDLP